MPLLPQRRRPLSRWLLLLPLPWRRLPLPLLQLLPLPPGITRDSVNQLLSKWGVKVSERLFTIDEVIAAQKDGTLTEAFGTGTAAIISPVGSIHYKGQDLQVAEGQTGKLSQKLYDYLLALQYGYEEDPFGWVDKIG